MISANLDVVLHLVLTEPINSRMLGYPEVIRFIGHAARWRRFFRSSLAASNF